MLKLLLAILIISVNLLKANEFKFPSEQDFDFVEDLIDQWKGERQLKSEPKGIVKIGSYAPSSTRLVESVDSAYPEGYYQQPQNHDLMSVKQYQPESQYSSVNSYGQPMVHLAYPEPNYYRPHPHQVTDHHYYHHSHGSHHHEADDHHKHEKESSTSTSQPIVRQQTVDTAQRVVQYVPLAVNPRQTNRSPTTSPWLWSLLFIIIFPTLLGAILLPLALVFLTNVVFVLLMLRNNNQATIIPNNQNTLKSRSLVDSFHLDEEMVNFIFKLIRKAEAIYGQSSLY
uniref:Uncharacterized protein n=1 Tax=Tetranychus urticae TaxID=32264 RepID=T1K541_TETUR